MDTGYKFICTGSLVASSKYWRVHRRTHKCPTSATRSNSTRGSPTCLSTSSTTAVYIPIGVFSHFSTFATARRNRCGHRVLESSCTGDLLERPRSRATPVPKTPLVFHWTGAQWEGTSSQKPSFVQLSPRCTWTLWTGDGTCSTRRCRGRKETFCQGAYLRWRTCSRARNPPRGCRSSWLSPNRNWKWMEPGSCQWNIVLCLRCTGRTSSKLLGKTRFFSCQIVWSLSQHGDQGSIPWLWRKWVSCNVGDLYRARTMTSSLTNLEESVVINPVFKICHMIVKL